MVDIPKPKPPAFEYRTTEKDFFYYVGEGLGVIADSFAVFWTCLLSPILVPFWVIGKIKDKFWTVRHED